MCRFLAYLGPPLTLEELLVAPAHSLYRQSWVPREQRHGTVNADGFGVGWYERSHRPEPALYRSTLPIWSDRSFASMAGVIASGAVLAGVRGGTEPVIPLETNVPPFISGRYLFAHNGAIEQLREGVASRLRRRLSVKRDSEILGTTDSEVIFALTLDALDTGASLTEAMVSAVTAVEQESTARLNLIATDGERIVATVVGDTLFVHYDGDRVFVCSEAFDESTSWKQIDDMTVLEATSSGIALEPLGVKGEG